MKFLGLELEFEFPSTDVVDLLLSDSKEIQALLLKDTDNQVLRRSQVRASLALTEALTDLLKKVTYDFATGVILPLQQHIGALKKHCPVHLVSQEITHSELALLRDEVANVSNSGQVIYATSYLDYKRNVKFAVQQLIKIFQIDIPDKFFKAAGWNALIDSTQLRNNLMHPKSVEALAVGDKELEQVMVGAQWMLDAYGELFSKVGDSVEASQIACDKWVQTITPDLIGELSTLLPPTLDAVKGGRG